MVLRTHSNGKMYPYPERTRLECLLWGIVTIPIFGLGFFFVYHAIKSKRKWNELITHEND